MSLVRSIGGRLMLLALASSAVLGILGSIAASATTAVVTTRYTYDASLVALVGVAPIEAAAAASGLFTGVQGESASLGEPDLSAATTGAAGRNTTNTVDDFLSKPVVSNTKLQNIVNDLYKGTTNPSRVGTGTTADAVRNELATGLPTGGKFHSEKARSTSTG